LERRLAAILAADVVGYSRLMGEDEVGTLAALKAHREALIDPKIAEHQGRIVKTTGDGMLVEFPSVVEAVQCAVEIQTGMAERNAEVPEDRRMLFRIGINVGDIIIEGDDIFGDGVNVAARLEGLAEPGGICVRRTVRDHVRDKLPLVFEDMGEVEVKNIARPVRVFRIIVDPDMASTVIRRTKSTRYGRRLALASGSILAITIAASLAWLQPWQPTPALDLSSASARPSIAVLPFTNLNRNPEQEYFSDGVTNDIITDLSKFHDLLVIASNSVFTYKGEAVNVQEVGRELGVRYVLEGSVQRVGERVRINAQLIDATTGHHLWADRYDDAARNLFQLQDQITSHIVRTLAVQLTDFEQERAFAKPTHDLEAYDYVLRGRQRLLRFGRADNFEARDLFRKAIELDPSYADAYAGLGWTYLNAFLFGWTSAPKDALERSEKLAQQALAIDASSVDGHRLLGRVYVNRRRHDLAMVELERVITLNPNNAQSYAEQGIVLVWSGRPDGAITSLEIARRFDPNMNAESLAHLGLAYYLKERYADAVKFLERSLAQNPDFQFGHQVLAAAYGQLGRAREALREADAVRRLYPFFDVDEYGRQFRDPAHAAHVTDGLRKAGL
jgi:TolB-like protein/class 3 adenylate cyclase